MTPLPGPPPVGGDSVMGNICGAPKALEYGAGSKASGRRAGYLMQLPFLSARDLGKASHSLIPGRCHLKILGLFSSQPPSRRGAEVVASLLTLPAGWGA